MAKKKQKKKKQAAQTSVTELQPKDFLDLIAPSAVRFNTDHTVCGDLYRCTMTLRSYPATTEELALLRNLGEKSGDASTQRFMFFLRDADVVFFCQCIDGIKSNIMSCFFVFLVRISKSCN